MVEACCCIWGSNASTQLQGSVLQVFQHMLHLECTLAVRCQVGSLGGEQFTAMVQAVEARESNHTHAANQCMALRISVQVSVYVRTCAAASVGFQRTQHNCASAELHSLRHCPSGSVCLCISKTHLNGCFCVSSAHRMRSAPPSSRTSRRASCASTPTTSTGTTVCCPRPGRTPVSPTRT